MDARELNVLVAALTNYFYTKLDKEDFSALSIFLNELSKSMFSTILFNDVCEKQNKKHLSAKCPKPKEKTSSENNASKDNKDKDNKKDTKKDTDNKDCK